jgi:outer membrane receptor for ferrienterochelin and colicins
MIMKKSMAIAGAVLAALTIGGNVQAENVREVELENMVVTATMPQKIMSEAPGAVEVISGEEIVEMNADTLADALEDATGLVMGMETGRQKRPSIRGTGNKHTLVLLDGRRISSGFKDLTCLAQIPAEMIDHIEVVRGPVSGLYGSDAIGGVINVITKKPSESLTGGVTAQYGQSTYGEGDESKGSAHISSTAGQFGFFLSGSYRDKEGYDRDGVTPDDGDDIEMKSAAGRLIFDMKDGGSLTAGFETVDKNMTGLRDIQNQDRERDADDKRLNYFLEYNGKPSAAGSLMLRAGRSEHENEIEFDPPTTLTPGTIGDETDAERTLDQLDGRYTAALGQRHVVTLGGQFLEESREDASGLDDSVETVSAYVQDEYQVADPLYLVMSLRYDDYSDYGEEWTPRASLTWSMTDNLRLKGSYGLGFRAPDFLELFIPTYMRRGKLVYEPNPELEAETSETYEIALEGEKGRFQGRITWFQNNIEDLIEAVYYATTGSGKKQKDYYRYQNIAEATTSGVEMEWGIELPAGFDLSGNLAYLDTEDKSTGEELEGRPDWKGSLKLAYRNAPSGFRANLRLKYIGEQYYADEPEDAVTTVSAYVSKDLTRMLTLFAGADNLFNAGKDNYVEPTFFYGGVSIAY